MLHLPKTAKGPIFLPVETTVRELDAKLLVAVTSRMILFPRGAILCGVHANC